MTQPTPPPAPAWRNPGYWSPLRLLAVASTIATIVIGIVIVVSTFHNGQSLQNWIGAGIISAGVALACAFLLQCVEVNPARRIAFLILLGVGVLVLAIIVQVAARDFQERLLAVIGILGGLAIVVVSLPTSNGKN